MTSLRLDWTSRADTGGSQDGGRGSAASQAAGPLPAASMAEPAPAAGNGPTARIARRLAVWLIPPSLAVAAAVGLVSAPPGSRGAPAAIAKACHASDWKSTVTLDGSQPEMAMAMLRSRNEVGASDMHSCVEVRLACRREGPYFEVRLSSPSLAMREVGPLQIRNLHDELSAQVFQPNAGGDDAVRIADKPAVELIAFALADSLAFSVPITFSTGDQAVAEFKSYHFSTAVRPVLFACNMRRLQSEDDDDDEGDAPGE